MNYEIQSIIATLIGHIQMTEFRKTTITDIYKEVGLIGTLASAGYILRLIKLGMVERPERIMPMMALPCNG